MSDSLQRKIKQESRAVMVAVVSCVMLIIGVNMPLYVEQVASSHTAMSRVNKEGLVILILAIVAAVLVYMKKQKYLLVVAFFVTGFMVHYILLFTSMESFCSISLGFYFQWVAAAGMVVSVFMLPKAEPAVEEETFDDSFANKTDKNKKDEHKFNETVNMNDIKWMAVSFLLAMGMVIIIDKNIITGENSKAGNNPDTVPMQTAYQDGSNQGELVQFDYAGDDFSIKVDKAFVVKDNDQIIVIMKFIFKNGTNEQKSFSDMVIVDPYQTDTFLNAVTGKASSVFDFNSKDNKIGKDQTLEIFIPYLLLNDTDAMNIKIRSYANTVNTMVDMSLQLDYTYYPDRPSNVQNDDNQAPDAGQATDAAASPMPTIDQLIVDEDDYVSPAPAKTVAPPAKTAEPVKTKTPETKKPATKAPTKTPVVKTVAPKTEAPIETEFTFYFNKPSSWGDTIHTYIYFEDGNVDEMAGWPGKAMKSLGDGKYSFTCDNKWKNACVIFSDGGNQWPASGARGVDLNPKATYSVP